MKETKKSKEKGKKEEERKRERKKREENAWVSSVGLRECLDRS